jgi:hypothetical protein
VRTKSKAHPGAFTGDSDVEEERHREAQRDAVAFDRADDRLAYIEHVVELVVKGVGTVRFRAFESLIGIQSLRRPRRPRLGGHLLIGAGAKRPAGAGHNDRTDGIVVIRIRHRLLDFQSHPGVKSVEAGGTVEGYDRDAVIFLVNDLGWVHARGS